MTGDTMTIGDRYAHAASSGNLTPRPDRRCDADVLLAAAGAASSPRRAVAQAIYRASVTRDLSGMPAVVDALADWIAQRARKQLRLIPLESRRAMSRAVVELYVDPACRYCAGRGHDVDEQSMRFTRVCAACDGSGRRRLEAQPPRVAEPAAWLVSQIDALLAQIHDDMARMLAPSLDLRRGAIVEPAPAAPTPDRV